MDENSKWDIDMERQPIIVLITAPSTQVGAEIAKSLLEKKLAACVNILSSVDSFYLWRGAINHDQEVLLIVKTQADLFEERLLPAIKAIHPYEIPEIIALPVIMGLPDYLNWMRDEIGLD